MLQIAGMLVGREIWFFFLLLIQWNVFFNKGRNEEEEDGGHWKSKKMQLWKGNEQIGLWVYQSENRSYIGLLRKSVKEIDWSANHLEFILLIIFLLLLVLI